MESGKVTFTISKAFLWLLSTASAGAGSGAVLMNYGVGPGSTAETVYLNQRIKDLKESIKELKNDTRVRFNTLEKKIDRVLIQRTHVERNNERKES